MDLKNFDDIRPYSDEEIVRVLEQLLANEQFCTFAEKTIGAQEFNTLKQQYKQIDTIQKFQLLAIKPFLDFLVKHKASSFSTCGIEHAAAEDGCLYMSNHRDIVIDVALLDKALMEADCQTVEIGIGDNLLIYPWIETLVRINRAFIVRRGGKGRDLLMQSKHLSEYIHYTIAQEKHSAWIAQREGRAKDSNDRTQESVLKMLAMGSDKPFADSLKELNIHPLAISYEYDPCDYLKAKEAQQRRDNPDFKKSQADDLLNMQTGIMGFKGRITYVCADNINSAIDNIATDIPNRNEQATAIARHIDKQIHANYNIYPINYIALDILSGTKIHAKYYTEKGYSAFAEYLRQQINKIDLQNKDEQFLREYLLKIYANPLINHLEATK